MAGGNAPKKKGNGRPVPPKRARGQTDDINSQLNTPLGQGSLSFAPLKPQFFFKTMPRPSNAGSTAPSPPSAQTSVLSGTLLGLGAASNFSTLNSPFFGVAPAASSPSAANPARAAAAGTEALNLAADSDATNGTGGDNFGIDGVDDPHTGGDADEEHGDASAGGEDNSAGKKKPKRVRSKWADFPMFAWVEKKLRELFLREVLRLDGRGDALELTACPHCGKAGTPDYRCLDCRGAELCRECTIFWHRYNPLHDIQLWNGHFYENVEPRVLGLDIQLAHRPGETCDMRSIHTRDKFTIIHNNGVKIVRMHFCKCALAGHVPAYAQLLRWRLWPATCDDPESATTFETLDLFHRLSLLGKLNGYDFVRAIEAATDGALVKGMADVRQRFMTCIRQFRHIFMFKRAGRGHEEGGIEGTPPGACAVVCPACPNSEYNLPQDWALRPFQWMYRVIVALDANFRLSNRLTRSSNRTDPNLTEGKAYLVPEDDYVSHMSDMEGVDIAVPSTCSRFGAMHQGNIQKGATKGLRTTGVAGCSCARHEHVFPHGIATLHKGERYVTMDYVFGCAVGFMRCASVVASYDIACQWSINLEARLARVPGGRALSNGATKFLGWMSEVRSQASGLLSRVQYAVPKFHLYGHKLACQALWSFLWLVGVGATDGEGCERIWSGANPAASSLREMGPGSMQDTMDDMVGAWNWQKTCGMGKLLTKRLARALKEAKEQCIIHTQLTQAIAEEDKERLDKKTAEVVAWEGDHSLPSPYFMKKTSMTVAQVKLQAAKAQGVAVSNAAQGRAGDEDEDEERTAAMASFVLKGLEIETEQARLAAKSTGDDDDEATPKQATTKVEAQKALLRLIRAFREAQQLWMPATEAALSYDERDPDRDSVVKVKLHLPSQPPRRMSMEKASSSALRVMESTLRWASMHDELDNLRHQLRLRGCLYRYKRRHIRGQRASTRSLTAQEAVNLNVTKAADAYRRHRVAYEALNGKGDWEKEMQVLEPTDCQGLGDRLIKEIEANADAAAKAFLAERGGKDRSGDTRHRIPWIWFATSEESGLQINDELMVEWCKSRARASRWVEEVRWVDEEMRRVVAFSETMISVWESRREPEKTIPLSPEDAVWAADGAWSDGVRAYASKQAWIRRQHACQWRSQFAVGRLDAANFLLTHSEDGLCVAPMDSLSERVDAMVLDFASKEK